MMVGGVRYQFLPYPLCLCDAYTQISPLLLPLGMARWAETPAVTRKHQQLFRAVIRTLYSLS